MQAEFFSWILAVCESFSRENQLDIGIFVLSQAFPW